MRARLALSPSPWWLFAVPWGVVLVAAYVCVALGAATAGLLVGLGIAATLAADLLALAPVPAPPRSTTRTVRTVDVELEAEAVRLGRRRVDRRAVRALRIVDRPDRHELVVDLGLASPLAVEVDTAEDARRIALALGGARAQTQRIDLRTGASLRRRRARSVAAASLALGLLGAALALSGSSSPVAIVVTALVLGLHATIQLLTDFGVPTVGLDPRALHTRRARVPLETIARITETEAGVAIEDDRGAVLEVPVATGRLAGDPTPAERSLFARSLASAVEDARPTERGQPLASTLRRGHRTAREWLADLDALARTAGEGYRAAIRVDTLAEVARDDRADDELRLAATRVLYRVAPGTPCPPDPRLLRVATEDEDEALEAFSDLENRRAWR